MTITTEAQRVQYNGSGTVGPFSFPYKFLAKVDLKVIKTSSAGTDTTLTLTTDYTVLGQGAATGGSVTLVVALAVGEKLTILLDMDYTQNTDYAENDEFPAETHESALDRLTLLIQQLRQTLALCLNASESIGPDVSLTLPSPSASSLIGWNADADALINVDSAVAVASVTDFMATLLDDATGFAGLRTLFAPQKVYLVDPSCTDQGAATAEGNRSVKDLVDSIGSDSAELWFVNYAAGGTASFAFDTSESIPANIACRFSQGTRLTQVTGDEVVTIAYPGQILAGESQQITAVDMIDFTYSGTVFPQWWGGPAIAGGVANATLAIRYAILSLDSSAGGTVRLRAGVYKVYPQSAGTGDHVFTIQKNNICIKGDGIGATKLDFYALSGNDPETNFELITAAVWRGYGFFIPGGATAPTKRYNVTIVDLEMDGNCDYDGPYVSATLVIPANTTTGAGWDVTHRAIGFNLEGGDANYIDGIRVERCWIHNWKGELLYGGTGTAGKIGQVVARDNKLNDCNGSVISVSGKNHISQNEIYNCTYAIEDSYVNLPCVYSDNILHDGGIALISLSNGGTGSPYGPVVVKKNVLYNSLGHGIHMNDPKDLFVADNVITDCGQTTNYRAIDLYDSSERIENVHIIGNQMVFNAYSCDLAMAITAGSGHAAQGLVIKDNVALLTKAAQDASKTLTRDYYFTGDYGPNCIFENNRGEGVSTPYGTGNIDTWDELLTTTAATLIASFTPNRPGIFAVHAYYRVITGATNIDIAANYYDIADNGNYTMLVNEVGKAVGDYEVSPLIITANGVNTINIYAQAGTANQVYVTATIQEIRTQGQDS